MQIAAFLVIIAGLDYLVQERSRMREQFNCVSDTMGETTSGPTSPLVAGQTQQLLWPVENLDLPQQVRKSR